MFTPAPTLCENAIYEQGYRWNGITEANTAINKSEQNIHKKIKILGEGLWVHSQKSIIFFSTLHLKKRT